MTKKNGDRLRIEDLSESDFAKAREIVAAVVASQSIPANRIGIVVLERILRNHWKGAQSLRNNLYAGLHDSLNNSLHASLSAGLNDGLRDGLNDSLYAGLNNSLHASLYAGLNDGLHDSLNAGLNAGLDAGLHAGLHAGLGDGLHDGLVAGLRDGLVASLRDGLVASLNNSLDNSLVADLYAGLNDSLYAGLHDGLNASLYAGLNDGLRDGLNAGLHDGLNAGLYAGLHDSLNAGLNAGLDAGLHAGLSAGLNDGLRDSLRDGLRKAKLCYCGVFWSWWLARYAIAEAFGCDLDKQKLFLLRAFCLMCPIVGENKDGDLIILPKPQRIAWNTSGTTGEPFYFPVYELHANSRPAVEYWGLFRLYYWHNVEIPERMGSVNCEHWKPEWIIDEKNAEVRRILLREIGYERAISTLGAEVRNTWREYELIRLTVPDMPVVYQLLKMTCPSTGDVHILRAPPDCETAEQAITWCNLGVHPDEFVSQA